MTGYDRESELKAFDDSKAGVKGLVDAGVIQIPRFFHQPLDAADCYEPTSDVRPEIPVIDLGIAHGDTSGREAVVELVRRASETFGFFQVVNHGIPRDVLDRMLEGVRRFNNQDLEVKMRYYTRDSSRNVRFNTNFDLFQSPAANWRDSLLCLLKPEPAARPEELPDAVRDIMLEYTGFIQKLGNVLFELLSEALGLETHYLNELECSKGLTLLSHYYPPCPEPQLTIGISKHSDSDFVTVLLQDHIGGLQVCYQNQWIEVPPVPGALIVNIGDLLQALLPQSLLPEPSASPSPAGASYLYRDGSSSSSPAVQFFLNPVCAQSSRILSSSSPAAQFFLHLLTRERRPFLHLPPAAGFFLLHSYYQSLVERLQQSRH